MTLPEPTPAAPPWAPPPALAKALPWLSWPFTLSPEGRAFFWTLTFAHLLLKVCVGLVRVTEDGYRMGSLMAPPGSLLLVATDVPVCFVLARLVDAATPAPWRRNVMRGLTALVVPFLAVNFFISAYFKGFLNRGLLSFNGASAGELAGYAQAAMGWPAWLFLVSLAALTAVYLRWPARVSASFLARPAWLPAVTCVAALALLPGLRAKTGGQSGWLAANPLVNLVRSYTESPPAEVTPATPEEAAAFTGDAALLRGEADATLDVVVPSQKGKNVLFVIVESLPYGRTTLAGRKKGLGLLERFAADGLSFTRFRTVFPGTTRSLLAFLCGVHPNAGEVAVTRFLPGYRCDSLVERLAAAGYRTGFFTASRGNYDSLGQSGVMAAFDRREDFFTLQPRVMGVGADALAVPERAVADALMAFVQSETGRPFFATYLMWSSHAPYEVPGKSLRHLPADKRYRRSLAYVEDELRDLLRRLQAAGHGDDTLVIVTADHGEAFGEHRVVNHAGDIFEEHVHIPLVIGVPGLGPHTTARPGSNVDFAPTLAGG